MSYAIITVGGKQYRVREGERLLVDRLAAAEGNTFNPRVLLVGGDGETDLAPSATVTARVVGHVLGEKVRIGKYRRRTGYRRHNGHRSRLTQIEIEAIGGAQQRAAQAEAPQAEAREAAAPAEPRPETPQVDAPEAAVPAEPRAEAPQPPTGYADLTVAQIAEAAREWRRPEIEAALEYEHAHAQRKGAIAALEAALAANEGSE